MGQALFEGGDLAEPNVLARLGKSSFGFSGHLLEPAELRGVDAEEAAAGAGVFVDAGRAVGAVAVAEGDLAEQEVLFELAPFLAGGGALLGAVAQCAAVLDERFVAAMKCSGNGAV